MNEENKTRSSTIAIVAAIVALLLGLCLGAVAGGAGGYFLGRSSAGKGAAALPTPGRLLVTPAPRVTPLPAVPAPVLPNTISGGALIQEVLSGGPAEAAGLKVGDVITKVDNVSLDANHQLADVLATYKPDDKVTLTVWRGTATRTITVKLGQNPNDATRAYLGVRFSELTVPKSTPSQ